MKRSFSFLDIKNKLNSPIKRKSRSCEELQLLEVNERRISDSSEIDIPTKKSLNYKKKLIKILLHFLTHLSLLALLEPIFFFNYANKIESKIFLDHLKSYFQKNNIFNQNFFNNIRENKILYHNLLLFLTNNQNNFNNYYTNINNNSLNGLENRIANNQQLENYSFQFFIIFFSILFVLLFINFFIYKINYWKIITENFILIIFISLYELWFFNEIVLKFAPLSDQETNLIFINCFINNLQFPEIKYLTNNTIISSCTY